MEFVAGAVLEGKVTGITKFGAFVALPEGKSGLVHISEISESYVSDIGQFLSVGQTVRVKILSVGEDGRISLSVKRAVPQQAVQRNTVPSQRITSPTQQPKPVTQSFEDKLKRFMQESEVKIADNKLYADHKQRNRKR